MAADLDINVRATTQSLEANIRRISAELNNLGRVAAQLSNQKFSPISESALGDAQDLEKTLRQIMSMHPSIATAVRASGQNPATPTAVNWQNVPLTPNQVRTMFQHIGGGQQRFQKDDAQTIGEHVAKAIGRFFGGVGGGAAQVSGSAISSGFGAGGFSGMGLLRGGLIGGGLFGAFKAGQALMEGYENAKTLALEMDKLKRQMGDIGISFNSLQAAAEAASQGLEINSVEAGKLMSEFNRLSGGVKDTGELMAGTRTGVGMSKALGLDPSAGVSFLANIRNITRGGSPDGDRKLALMIGDVVTRSGMNARADEVLQAIQSFAAATSRISLTNPNLAGFGGAYAGMLSSRIPGLTPELAAAMLGQANSAMMNMGAFGEASHTFTLSAFNRFGKLNPIQAQVLAEGGLYGNRAGAFGKNSVYREYMIGQGISESDVDKLIGGNGDISNYEAIRKHLDAQKVDPHIKAEMAKNYFGLSSISQAMAMLSIKPEEIGKTEKLLSARGINLRDYNETGIMTLSKIANAGGLGDLQSVASSMMGRKGRGEMSSTEKMKLERALIEAQEKGTAQSFEKLRDTLAEIAKDKNKEETTASKMLDAQKSLETAITDVGDKLLSPLVDIKSALLSKFGISSRAARESAKALDLKDVDEKYQGEIDSLSSANRDRNKADARNLERLKARRQQVRYGNGSWPSEDARQAEERQLNEQIAKAEQDTRDRNGRVSARIKELEQKRDTDRSDVEKRYQTQSVTGGMASSLGRVQFSADEEQSLAQVAGGDARKLSFLKNVLRIENRGNERVRNDAVSPVGARGAFQFMPRTARSLANRLGMSSYDLSNFGDSAKLAGAYYDELYARYGGNRAKMYADYNGGPSLARNAGATGNSENDQYVAMGGFLDGRGVGGDTALPNGDPLARFPRSWAQQQSLAPWDINVRITDPEGRQRAAPISRQIMVPVAAGRG